MDLRELEPKERPGDVSSVSTDFEDQTLHDALQESLDSMTGACSRLRGDDMVSVIEEGEMTVLAFAPPARFEEQEIVKSFRRSELLAAEILTMGEPEQVNSRPELYSDRLCEVQQQLIDKDMEIHSLRRQLHDARHAAAASQAKLCRVQATLKVRDEMIKAKNQDISEMHLELHSAAREVAMARRHHERPQSDNLAELDFLRRQCKLLEEMNQQLRRDQWQAASASSASSGPDPIEEMPSEPIASRAPEKAEKEPEVNSGPLPSISRAAAKATMATRP